MHSSVTIFPGAIDCGEVETERQPIPMKPWAGRVMVDPKLGEIERLGGRCRDAGEVEEP